MSRAGSRQPSCPPAPQQGAACLLGFFVLLKVHKPKAPGAPGVVHHDFDAQRLSCKREGKHCCKESSTRDQTKPPRDTGPKGRLGGSGEQASSTRNCWIPAALWEARMIPPIQYAALIAVGFSGSLATSSHLFDASTQMSGSYK